MGATIQPQTASTRERYQEKDKRQEACEQERQLLRYDRRCYLEQSTGQLLHGTEEIGLWDGIVQADDANVLLSGILLGLDQTGGTLDANDQASGDLEGGAQT